MGQGNIDGRQCLAASPGAFGATVSRKGRGYTASGPRVELIEPRRLFRAQWVKTFAAAAVLLAFAAAVASAQTPDQFYKGRQITMIVFSGAGSTYDFYARLLARHLGSHVPPIDVFNRAKQALDRRC